MGAVGGWAQAPVVVAAPRAPLRSPAWDEISPSRSGETTVLCFLDLDRDRWIFQSTNQIISVSCVKIIQWLPTVRTLTILNPHEDLAQAFFYLISLTLHLIVCRSAALVFSSSSRLLSSCLRAFAHAVPSAQDTLPPLPLYTCSSFRLND